MTLGAKQEQFALCLSELIEFAHSKGWGIRIGEVMRTREQAALYADRGKGIKNSVHCLKLAADLYLSVGGQVTWRVEDYAPLGEYWKDLSPLARWGGDFKNRDAVHFSFLHKGVC